MTDIHDILNECKVNGVDVENDDRPLTILITDTNLDPPGPTILYAGGAIETLTGYKPDELVGKTPRVLQGAKSDKQVLKKLREALKDRRFFIGHTINYRKDGTPMMMIWAVCPVYGENGEVLYFFSIHADGSDGAIQARSCSLAEKLERVRGALEKAGNSLSRSAANIGSLLEQLVEMREDGVR